MQNNENNYLDRLIQESEPVDDFKSENNKEIEE